MDIMQKVIAAKQDVLFLDLLIQKPIGVFCLV